MVECFHCKQEAQHICEHCRSAAFCSQSCMQSSKVHNHFCNALQVQISPIANQLLATKDVVGYTAYLENTRNFVYKFEQLIQMDYFDDFPLDASFLSSPSEETDSSSSSSSSSSSGARKSKKPRQTGLEQFQDLVDAESNTGGAFAELFVFNAYNTMKKAYRQRDRVKPTTNMMTDILWLYKISGLISQLDVMNNWTNINIERPTEFEMTVLNSASLLRVLNIQRKQGKRDKSARTLEFKLEAKGWLDLGLGPKSKEATVRALWNRFQTAPVADALEYMQWFVKGMLFVYVGRRFTELKKLQEKLDKTSIPKPDGSVDGLKQHIDKLIELRVLTPEYNEQVNKNMVYVPIIPTDFETRQNYIQYQKGGNKRIRVHKKLLSMAFFVENIESLDQLEQRALTRALVRGYRLLMGCMELVTTTIRTTDDYFGNIVNRFVTQSEYNSIVQVANTRTEELSSTKTPRARPRKSKGKEPQRQTVPMQIEPLTMPIRFFEKQSDAALATAVMYLGTQNKQTLESRNSYVANMFTALLLVYPGLSRDKLDNNGPTAANIAEFIGFVQQELSLITSNTEHFTTLQQFYQTPENLPVNVIDSLRPLFEQLFFNSLITKNKQAMEFNEFDFSVEKERESIEQILAQFSRVYSVIEYALKTFKTDELQKIDHVFEYGGNSYTRKELNGMLNTVYGELFARRNSLPFCGTESMRTGALLGGIEIYVPSMLEQLYKDELRLRQTQAESVGIGRSEKPVYSSQSTEELFATNYTLDNGIERAIEFLRSGIAYKDETGESSMVVDDPFAIFSSQDFKGYDYIYSEEFDGMVLYMHALEIYAQYLDAFLATKDNETVTTEYNFESMPAISWTPGIMNNDSNTEAQQSDLMVTEIPLDDFDAFYDYEAISPGLERPGTPQTPRMSTEEVVSIIPQKPIVDTLYFGRRTLETVQDVGFSEFMLQDITSTTDELWKLTKLYKILLQECLAAFTIQPRFDMAMALFELVDQFDDLIIRCTCPKSKSCLKGLKTFNKGCKPTQRSKKLQITKTSSVCANLHHKPVFLKASHWKVADMLTHWMRYIRCCNAFKHWMVRITYWKFINWRFQPSLIKSFGMQTVALS